MHIRHLHCPTPWNSYNTHSASTALKPWSSDRYQITGKNFSDQKRLALHHSSSLIPLISLCTNQVSYGYLLVATVLSAVKVLWLRRWCQEGIDLTICADIGHPLTGAASVLLTHAMVWKVTLFTCSSSARHCSPQEIDW